MSGDLDPVSPDDAPDPAVLARAREQFMLAIGDDDPSPAPVPTPDVYPRLAYGDELAAVEYLVRVFQFGDVRAARTEVEGGNVCYVRMGTGIVMIGRADPYVDPVDTPYDVGLTTVLLHVYVPDVDAHYAHAIAEGAEITLDIDDTPYGDRRYEAIDPEGHRWRFAQRFDDIRARTRP